METMAERPMADNIPIAFNSCRTGPRSINWRSDKPAELYWAEAQDGGDPSVECSPRDIVYTLKEPFNESAPKELAKCDYRYNGIVWGKDDLAILGESWWKNRRARTWIINPEDPSQEPEILFDRSYEDSYNDPRTPLTKRNELGKYTLAFFQREFSPILVLFSKKSKKKIDSGFEVLPLRWFAFMQVVPMKILS